MSVPLQEKVTCPFDKAHTIERRRLSHHIIKCKKVHFNINVYFVYYVSYLSSPLLLPFRICQQTTSLWNACSTICIMSSNGPSHLWVSAYLQFILLYFKISHFHNFFTAQPSRFKAPKLLVDESAANNFCTESWDDPPSSNQPVFNSDTLKKNAPHMMYFCFYI